MTNHQQQTSEFKPTQKWLPVLLLWLVCLINYADRQAVFSVFPLIKQSFGLSVLQLGVVGSSFMWMYAIFGSFAGWLVDRLPRKTIVLTALIFWSLATAATSLTRNYPQLVVCRALGGLGEAFYFPAAMSLISDYHGVRSRSKAMSLHQSGVYAGTIAGGALSGYIGQLSGWRLSFTLLGCAGVALGLVLAFFLKEPARGSSDPVETLRERAGDLPRREGLAMELTALLKSNAVVLLICVFAGANFVAVVFLTWMPTFLVEKFHMSLTMAGLSGTAYQQVASILGVLAGGILADRMVRRTKNGRWITQAFGLFCGVPFLFAMGLTTRVGVLMLALTGFGFFKGMYDANLFAGLYDVVPTHRRGAAAGLLNSLGWLGGGFAPVLIALAAAGIGFSAALSATASVYLLIACALILGASSTVLQKRV